MITENFIICDNCGYKIKNNFECLKDIYDYFDKNKWLNIKEWLNSKSKIIDICPNCNKK